MYFFVLVFTNDKADGTWLIFEGQALILLDDLNKFIPPIILDGKFGVNGIGLWRR